MTEQQFWIEIRRAMLIVVKAVESRYLGAAETKAKT